MSQLIHRNATFATMASLSDLINTGATVQGRGGSVLEVRNRFIVIERPRERCIFLPNRKNNVIASLAEALWVVSGRDDVEWIATYLPRARQFSDDGYTWRGAYGPRLRNWNGVDQLAESHRLLLQDVSTRRAVMSLFDPGRDYVDSKDIPCNNWLHWLAREDRLHLTIGVRSNDVLWGFSGVNTFEWSILQDMMAYWVGTQIGQVAYLATSFHLYDYHFQRATSILENFNGVTCYDFGIEAPVFSTDFAQFDQVLDAWFKLEEEVRQNPEHDIGGQRRLGDQLLAVSLELMRIDSGVRHGWRAERVADELAQLPVCDLTAAAYEFYGRRYPGILDTIPDSQIAGFIAAFRGGGVLEPAFSGSLIVRAIKSMHAEKDEAYGTAWKRRGELFSILCNVARKVDRLEQYTSSGVELANESVLDTAVDLFVYLLKYRLFLLEMAASAELVQELPTVLLPISDSLSAFDESADRFATRAMPAQSATQLSRLIVQDFERLHGLVVGGEAPVAKRLTAVSYIAELAFDLIRAISQEQPSLVRAFVRHQ